MSENFGERIFFVVSYGHRKLQSNGIPYPYDIATTGTLHTTLEQAIEDEKFYFNGMINEVKSHYHKLRDKEEAFAFIQAVNHVSDDNPDGEDAFHLLDDATKDRVNACDLLWQVGDDDAYEIEWKRKLKID